MVSMSAAATGVSVLAASILTLGTAPPASASDGQTALNGTFSVVSNGEWATMNDRYQDEPSVRSTWTVNSSCSTDITCVGKVTSTLGWTEDIYTVSNMWYVKHYVPDWIPCPDGSRAPGLEVFRFYPTNEEGTAKPGSNLLVGVDQTTGESGNCGRNRSLVLELPVKITKIS